MNYVLQDDFNKLENKEGYTKYAQVTYQTTNFGKRLPVVTQVVYADFDPNQSQYFNTKCRHVPILEEDVVSVGMVLDPASATIDNKNFISLESAYRQVHTDSELLYFVRNGRHSLLAACDPLVLRHMSQPEGAKTLTEAEYAELQGYMQALRDFPANVNLDNIVWPPKPAFMA